MPITNGATKLPRVVSRLQVPRHRGDSRLSRYSKETPRTMSAASSRTSGRYKLENSVAYQPGKAANIAAAATTSQTSLPSHRGPIESTASWRSSSDRPTAVCSMPTPKSKPSSTKNPVHSSATRTNQTTARPMSAPSVRHRADASVGRRLHDGVGGLGTTAGVVDHEPPGDHREH